MNIIQLIKIDYKQNQISPSILELKKSKNSTTKSLKTNICNIYNKKKQLQKRKGKKRLHVPIRAETPKIAHKQREREREKRTFSTAEKMMNGLLPSAVRRRRSGGRITASSIGIERRRRRRQGFRLRLIGDLDGVGRGFRHYKKEFEMWRWIGRKIMGLRL